MLAKITSIVEIVGSIVAIVGKIVEIVSRKNLNCQLSFSLL